MPPLIDPALLELVAEQRSAVAGKPPQPVLPAEDLSVSETLHVRVIRPQTPIRGVYYFIHGGGFIHGAPQMSDVANADLARDLSVATVAVGYRLAPEYPHPAAFEDCLAGALWLLGSARRFFGTDRLLIGGGSVGASLAVLTLIALRERGHGGRFRAANLIAGNYDFSGTPSQRRATPRHFLSPQHLQEMRDAAFPGLAADELRSPSISSLYAGLEGMPPAIFTVGGADAVLDDTLFMFDRWLAAGNAAERHVYPEADHTFLSLPTRMAAQARRRMAIFLAAHL